MKVKNVLECERNELDKLKKYQLSNSYKKIGLAILILSFIAIILRKFYFEELLSLQLIAKNGMLVGLLIIIISKEKIEDELISKIRGQAFSFAFIAAVIYALVMPFTDYAVDLIVDIDTATYEDIGDFVLLWFMMVIYLAFFTVLKRTR